MNRSEAKHFLAEWLLALVAIFLTVVSLAAIAYFVFDRYYGERILPNISLGQINLGGLTREQATKVINEKIDGIHQNGFVFYFKTLSTAIYPTVTSAETDLSYELVSFKAAKTADQAWLVGRSASPWGNFRDRLRLLFHGREVSLIFEMKEMEMEKILAENFAGHTEPAQAAALAYENGKFTVTEEKAGRTIDYAEGLKKLKSDLGRLVSEPITLAAVVDRPRLSRADGLAALGQAENILLLSPFVLTDADDSWPIEQDRLGAWLALKPGPAGRGAVVGLDREQAADYLKKTVSPVVNIDPVEAKFDLQEGRVKEFQAGREGRLLAVDASLDMIESAWQRNATSAELAIDIVPNRTAIEDVNRLGIKELVGTGHSDFAGSPSNRRHNIRTGATALHGQLIEPEQEFSLNRALGEIEAETGYLPELVIKGNKTVPEYGGGLCQIGTTMFRAALAAGLPITERRNHSYRVSYYEPAGMDATIYSPAPDLKFVNDTGRHILIQYRIEGDDLYFDFWGTADGRVASVTRPVIYNIIKPGPTKYIETTDLKPGEKKCTERAHSGADTYFDYTVSFPDGSVKERRFASHYVPWREVCLLGVEKLSEIKEEGGGVSATSTPPATESSPPSL